MSNKFLKNSAFCVLPFIEEFFDLKGQQKFCCHSHLSITDQESANQARLEILNGKKIPHCENCYRVEKQGIISPRLVESSRWLKDSEVTSYIESWHPQAEQKIFFYDIRFDNKCNLACISCNPTSSSLWSRELGIKTTPTDLDLDLDQVLKAKKIYLAGGEPLIIDQFCDLLTRISLSQVQPEVVINTNLTRVNDDLKNTLSKIQNLTLTVSVDAMDKVNEYHRWPMKWQKFYKNLVWAKEIGCNIQFNSVVDAVTVLNIDRLCELENFCNQWNLSILTRPEALQINNLPEQLKKSVHENFLRIHNSKFYSTDPVFRTRVNNIAETILLPGNPELLSAYISSLDSRRDINHFNYLGTTLT